MIEKVEISLKKGHPRREMRIGQDLVTETPVVLSIDEKFLNTVEAKHWFNIKKVSKKGKPSDDSKSDFLG